MRGQSYDTYTSQTLVETHLDASPRSLLSHLSPGFPQRYVPQTSHAVKQRCPRSSLFLHAQYSHIFSLAVMFHAMLCHSLWGILPALLLPSILYIAVQIYGHSFVQRAHSSVQLPSKTTICLTRTVRYMQLQSTSRRRSPTVFGATKNPLTFCRCHPMCACEFNNTRFFYRVSSFPLSPPSSSPRLNLGHIPRILSTIIKATTTPSRKPTTPTGDNALAKENAAQTKRVSRENLMIRRDLKRRFDCVTLPAVPPKETATLGTSETVLQGVHRQRETMAFMRRGWTGRKTNNGRLTMEGVTVEGGGVREGKGDGGDPEATGAVWGQETVLMTCRARCFLFCCLHICYTHTILENTTYQTQRLYLFNFLSSLSVTQPVSPS